MAKSKKEVEVPKPKRGRKPIEDAQEKVSPLTFFAKKRNHEAIVKKVKPIITELDK